MSNKPIFKSASPKQLKARRDIYHQYHQEDCDLKLCMSNDYIAEFIENSGNVYGINKINDLLGVGVYTRSFKKIGQITSIKCNPNFVTFSYEIPNDLNHDLYFNYRGQLHIGFP